MMAGEGSADDIIKAKGLVQITDESAIVAAIDDVMAKNPGQLAEYRAGKDKLFGFFVGQTLRATQGKANPDALNRLLKEKLARSEERREGKGCVSTCSTRGSKDH